MSVRDFLLRKKRAVEEEFLWPETRLFFAWVKEKIKEPEETVAIFFPWEKKGCSLREGRWQKRSLASGKTSGIRFLLCLPQALDEALAETEIPKEGWFPLYRSTRIEIWEQKRHSLKPGLWVPLRLGLSNEEKIQVTKEVRRMLGEVLEGKEPVLPDNLSERFSETQILDVAVWVEGRLRASVIVDGLSCREALARASWRVPRDDRFKPITREELPEARIEITFLSDLLMPVSEAERQKNEIDPTKGYATRLEKKSGWGLPKIHNSFHFFHLQNFIAYLLEEIKEDDRRFLKDALINQFEVLDWIENSQKKQEKIITLSGPTLALGDETRSVERIKRVAERAVEWLLFIQETDGNIPAVMRASSGVIKTIDWARLAFTASALVVYSKAFHDKRAAESADKILSYIDSYLPLLEEKKEFITLVYYARAKLILKESPDALLIQKIAGALPRCSNHLITALQILSLLAEWEQEGHQEYSILLREQSDLFLKRFESDREKEKTHLALYPELIVVLDKLWQLTDDKKWKEQATSALRWYLQKQLPNGSFPNAPGKMLGNTRGSGKIFEVLPCFPEESGRALWRSFLWLESLQYTDESTFWVPENRKKIVLGAFRHDAFYTDAWIDGAAHIILGATRWLEHLKKEKKNEG